MEFDKLLNDELYWKNVLKIEWKLRIKILSEKKSILNVIKIVCLKLHKKIPCIEFYKNIKYVTSSKKDNLKIQL